jgi:hypothetical protein
LQDKYFNVRTAGKPAYRKYDTLQLEIGILGYSGNFIDTVIFFLIPAISPGFPIPVVSSVQLASVSPSGSANLDFVVDTTLFNKGTKGNVIVVTKLVNASRNSIEGKESRTLYMNADEVRSIRTTVKGPFQGTLHYRGRGRT